MSQQSESDESDNDESEKEQASNKEDPPKPQTSNEEGVDPVAGEKRKLAALTSAVSDSGDESWELTDKLIKFQTKESRRYIPKKKIKDSILTIHPVPSNLSEALVRL